MKNTHRDETFWTYLPFEVEEDRVEALAYEAVLVDDLQALVQVLEESHLHA